ncbi:MucR family transcriptional regulator [Komagataeibacter saccharivorans]|uniref:MucR family transcriptional regulator n=1 Tax=Komagataeibacter saccharivorans TaxID=265959 RepID=UPI0024A7B48F|nr:MucR family transcriptional regulator [Komagataeibacter saccharivorans]
MRPSLCSKRRVKIRSTNQQATRKKEPINGSSIPPPAIPVNRSVFPEYIICLEDGVRRKMLKRYLRTFHGMTVDEYRKRWGLPQHYPMVAPNYAIRRSSIARQAGLGQTVTHDSTDRTGPDN